MAILKNTTIQGTNALTLQSDTVGEREEPQYVVTSFTTVGSSTWTCPTGVNSVEVLVIAGGGGGGGEVGGGGGAGGLIYRNRYPVTPGSVYAITVGGGGGGGTYSASNGSNGYGQAGFSSQFDSLIALGGGNGSAYRGASGNAPGGGGGSGGGGACSDPGGLGNTGGASFSNQGNSGGAGGYSSTYVSGGGGGAGGPGGDAGGGSGGGGGLGLPFSISGSVVWYAGGGGGSYQGTGIEGAGGMGGGGKGGNAASPGGTNGTANTGGGGGGSYDNTSPAAVGGNGGSGIVILRYALSLQSGIGLSGRIRTSADHSEVEVFEGNFRNAGWTSSDQSINFAGHNLLANSENFTTGTYTLVNTSLTSGQTAPDGTATAYRLVETNSVGVHGILAINSMVVNAIHTFSIHAKADQRSWLAIRADNQTNWNYFNLANGTIGTTNTVNNTRARIKSLGNGWYRCSITYQPTGSGNDPEVYIANADNSNNYSGSSSNGLYIWGAQLELHEAAPGPYSATSSMTSPTPYFSSGYRIHRYLDAGGTCYFAPALTGNVEVLVVGGGGGGGTDVGGGGSGGGVVYRADYAVEAGKTYKVQVGTGGAAGGGAVGGTGANGGNSQFGNIIAIGGGGAGYYYARMGYNGGSGGGQGGTGPNNLALVAGTYFPGEGTLGQGHRGGMYRAGSIGGGGGGGAGGPGYDQWGYGADGGPGVGYDISGTLEYYGGGGGAGDSGGVNQIGYGGIGGGGDGDSRNASTSYLQVNGRPNTGGGGGGDGGWTQPGSGGSGIVIVRYRANK